MRHLATTGLVALALVLLAPICQAQDPSDEAPMAATPPLPTRTPVNLRQMTFRRVEPKAGYRYAGLSGSQTRALRRDFRLSLEALAKADTPAALAKAAEVAPLPNPNEPVLAARPVAASGGNPFTGAGLTAFRDDPMRALGERLGADFESASASSSESSFGLAESDPVDPEPNAADADAGSADDPFGASDDPFATDASASEDPFDF